MQASPSQAPNTWSRFGICFASPYFRGLKRWDEGRWVEGFLVYALLYWGLLAIPHLPSSHRLSPSNTTPTILASREESRQRSPNKAMYTGGRRGRIWCVV